MPSHRNRWGIAVLAGCRCYPQPPGNGGRHPGDPWRVAEPTAEAESEGLFSEGGEREAGMA
jgi:hypothetical protein